MYATTTHGSTKSQTSTHSAPEQRASVGISRTQAHSKGTDGSQLSKSWTASQLRHSIVTRPLPPSQSDGAGTPRANSSQITSAYEDFVLQQPTATTSERLFSRTTPKERSLPKIPTRATRFNGLKIDASTTDAYTRENATPTNGDLVLINNAGDKVFLKKASFIALMDSQGAINHDGKRIFSIKRTEVGQTTERCLPDTLQRCTKSKKHTSMPKIDKPTILLSSLPCLTTLASAIAYGIANSATAGTVAAASSAASCITSGVVLLSHVSRSEFDINLKIVTGWSFYEVSEDDIVGYVDSAYETHPKTGITDGSISDRAGAVDGIQDRVIDTTDTSRQIEVSWLNQQQLSKIIKEPGDIRAVSINNKPTDQVYTALAPKFSGTQIGGDNSVYAQANSTSRPASRTSYGEFNDDGILIGGVTNDRASSPVYASASVRSRKGNERSLYNSASFKSNGRVDYQLANARSDSGEYGLNGEVQMLVSEASETIPGTVAGTYEN